jgi:hypothetical protein
MNGLWQEEMCFDIRSDGRGERPARPLPTSSSFGGPASLWFGQGGGTGVPPAWSFGKRAGRPFPLGFASQLLPNHTRRTRVQGLPTNSKCFQAATVIDRRYKFSSRCSGAL